MQLALVTFIISPEYYETAMAWIVREKIKQLCRLKLYSAVNKCLMINIVTNVYIEQLQISASCWKKVFNYRKNIYEE